MDKTATSPGPGDRQRAKREARAHRILDAAAALVVRWGYHKTTIDDIARQAGIAKGTIYLHWKTRDDLFAALLHRERLALDEDVRRRLAAEPQGATLHAMMRHSALALMQRPLLKAVLLGDAAVVGQLAHDPRQRAPLAERADNFAVYLEALRAHGLVRTDQSLRAQVYLVSAVFAGFFMIASLMPEPYQLSDEELADMLAEAVHRTLAPAPGTSTAAATETDQALARYLDRDAAIAAGQLWSGLDSAPAGETGL